MRHPFLVPALLVLGAAALSGCRAPDTQDPSGYVRYAFDLQISPDATAGFVCIASVTDQLGRGTLRTQPFRAMPGKRAFGKVDEPNSGARFEATVKVDAAGRVATYRARLVQKDRRPVVFEATRDIPKA
jgi:hypothetical protein